MRGRIVKRSADSYSLIFDLEPGVDGKRRQKRVTVRCGHKEAEHKLREYLRQVETGQYVAAHAMTVNQFFEKWMADHVRLNLSPTTARSYATFIKCYIAPTIGRLPLTSLRPHHLVKLYADKQREALSARTVRHLAMIVHAALELAVQWQLINRNPADKLKAPKAQRLEMSIWTEAEAMRFMEHIKTTDFYALFATALHTGLRLSELLGLQMGDVDTMGMQLRVTRSKHDIKGGGYIYRDTKTNKARRLVALGPDIALTLSDHIRQQQAIFARLGKPVAANTPLFNRLGKPLRNDYVSHVFIKTVRAAGLPHIRLHDLRHTHASLLLKGGVNVKVISERLGHSTVALTMDTYSHILPGMQHEAAAMFDAALRGENGHNLVTPKITSKNDN